jgi:hypothetical protein
MDDDAFMKEDDREKQDMINELMEQIKKKGCAKKDSAADLILQKNVDKVEGSPESAKSKETKTLGLDQSSDLNQGITQTSSLLKPENKNDKLDKTKNSTVVKASTPKISKS